MLDRMLAEVALPIARAVVLLAFWSVVLFSLAVIALWFGVPLADS